MRLETKLNQMIPTHWPTVKVTMFELWRDCEGGWSVNDGWTVERARGEAIALLRDRWEVFKLNYLPKARVKDLADSSSEENKCCLEVDFTSFADVEVIN